MTNRLAARLRSDAPHRIPARQVRATALALVMCTLTTWAAACSSGPPKPATLDTRNEACAHCRMTVSDKRFAAQIVAPGEEPRFFDDIGCLRSYLAKTSGLAAGSIAYVADYRDGTWLPAARAVYLQDDRINTPMASGLIAFADGAARDASPEARTGTRQSPTDVFGASAPPEGTRR